MLNLGLIGEVDSLEPYVLKALEKGQVHVIGKSSVGFHTKHGSSVLQVPEFNRIELIERSDILFINKFSLLPFSLLCEMVKKSKHFFAAGYPDLQPPELLQLAKLAAEAKTTVQISNPFYYYPALQWFSSMVKQPVYVDVTYYESEIENREILLQLILMLKDLTGQVPKKTSAISFNSAPANSMYQNIQLDMGNGSVINVNSGKSKDNLQFTLKAYMNGLFVELDLINNTIIRNLKSIDLSEISETDEISSFLYAVQQNKHAATGLEAYANALQTMTKIKEKLSRYVNN